MEKKKNQLGQNKYYLISQLLIYQYLADTITIFYQTQQYSNQKSYFNIDQIVQLFFSPKISGFFLSCRSPVAEANGCMNYPSKSFRWQWRVIWLESGVPSSLC